MHVLITPFYPKSGNGRFGFIIGKDVLFKAIKRKTKILPIGKDCISLHSVNYRYTKYSFMGKYNLQEIKPKEAKYRSLVSPEMMDRLQEGILKAIVMEKKYKDKDYSAKRLAEDLGTNTRYISAVVNTRFHQNFTSFVNSYRINDAMSLLTDKRCMELNMGEIADLVGFANRQSFYAAFFKFQGMTPREYRMNYLLEHPDAAGRRKK